MNNSNNKNNTKGKVELLKPRNDYVFQSLFTQKNEEITKNFISALLNEKVEKIKINDTKELFRENPEDKLGILDLEAEINEREKVDIEIQIVDKHNLAERLLFYFSRLYSMQVKIGKKYKDSKRVVMIAIIDYDLDITKEIEKMETIWNLREKNRNEIVLTDKIEFRIIELRKVLKEYERNRENEKAQWMMFINNPNDMEVQEIVKENKKIKEATVEIVKMSQDEKTRKLAELREKAIMDEKAAFSAGKEDGIELGIKQGELKTKLNIAKNMKSKKIDIETIIEITGLNKEEIEKL